jgi:hypothetical protein
MGFELLSHQVEALLHLKNGSVLVGGVGSGKSITALEYYRRIAPRTPVMVVTTAKKRDSGEWYRDALLMGLECDLEVISWNALSKCENEVGINFIFDEQRVVGYGSWTKSFIEITKRNRWLLLTATPADVWMDLVPVFIAHGFYRNKSDFCEQHVVWSRFAKYPKVERYVDEDVLRYYRNKIFVEMPHIKTTTRHEQFIDVGYSTSLQRKIYTERWNPYEEQPIKDAGEMVRLLRRAANTDPSRSEKLLELMDDHPRLIVFYNHNYELELLRLLTGTFFQYEAITVAEWNGHKHEPIPDCDRWVYLVQYQAGSEGWNCTDTDTVVFYSLPYSYRNYEQAKGRIDRLNTPYTDLNYYIFRSRAIIDQAIWKNLQKKKNFQISAFNKKHWPSHEKHLLKGDTHT